MVTKRLNKKAQVAIFIILALILVVGIVIVFVLIREPEVQVTDVENPQAYIDSCTREAVEEALGILMPQGGDIKPEGYIKHQGENITYLCYNENYYLSCINQRPMLIEHIEEEITNYIEPRINSCFNNLRAELERKKYVVNMGEGMNLRTNLQTKQVVVDINKDFKITKRGQTQGFKNFKMTLAHPIYDLAKIAMEISNQEAHYCNFDILGFMIIYPNYDINKFRRGSQDTIYKIKEISTNQEFDFAIRSCALPAGF